MSNAPGLVAAGEGSGLGRAGHWLVLGTCIAQLAACGAEQGSAGMAGSKAEATGAQKGSVAGDLVQGELLGGVALHAPLPNGSAANNGAATDTGFAEDDGGEPGLALAQLPEELQQRWGLAPAPAPAGHRQVHGRWSEPPRGLPDGVAVLSFADLSSPEYRPRALLEPEHVTAPTLSPLALAQAGQRVAIAGFPMPFDLRSDGLHALWLMPAPPGCCFGALAGLDAQVEVELSPAGPRDLSILEPRWLVGTFEAGEQRDAYGFVQSLFRLRGAQLLSE